MSTYPRTRLRRLRRTERLRRMFNMSMPGPEKFIWPVFVTPGTNTREEIGAMPGQFRYSPDELCRALEKEVPAQLGGILLFGVPGEVEKDNTGTPAADPEGVVPQTVEKVKQSFPELPVFTDVCLCAYTSHGHCGPVTEEEEVDNDAANRMLGEVALVHAMAGADCVAPSAMMDGQVSAIRTRLDEGAMTNTMILSYSTKFASSMYDPFREAEQSAPQGGGDRQGYQAPYADIDQALRESRLDEEEGADMLMVKPSLLYMDVITQLKEHTRLPVAAYNVSGEYAMLRAAADAGRGDLGAMVRESTLGLFRAGADVVISYWANHYDRLL